MADSIVNFDKPQQVDLDRCVHCGLCLNACPTYRELGVEMDSPRGRIYQMNQVAAGAEIGPSYVEHIELCLACRACETACPSGVQYGRLVEAARSEIEAKRPRPLGERLLRSFVFGHLLPMPRNAQDRRCALPLSVRRKRPATGGPVFRLVAAVRQARKPGESGAAGRDRRSSSHRSVRHFQVQGERRYRVAFMAGCIANVSFARLNEATVRVLQRNGCEVVVPGGQNCCGALHVHTGLREEARKLARNNIDAVIGGGFDAIITNAAGCGSTLKEYDELLLEHDAAYAEKARAFKGLMKDVNEFLASIDLDPHMGELPITVTYQDSCHLAHGQRVRTQPRKLLRAVPGLQFREMPMSDLCCGSAPGIYNVVQNEMAMQILKSKMDYVNMTAADVIVTANPGCMLQLKAGATLHGKGQRVAHVVEILDVAYKNYTGPL